MLIAAAGHAGAGKTTALNYLSQTGVGSYEYVGAFVHKAVLEAGLELTPENERKVRADLRERLGMAAMARLALPELRRKAVAGNVLVDAIYNEEERDLYLNELGANLFVIGLIAPVPVRAERVKDRGNRSISPHELMKRDSYELETLRLDNVIDKADVVLQNSGSLAEFEAKLAVLAAQLRN